MQVSKELALTPLQLGMLFHVLQEPFSGIYISQAVSYVDSLQESAYTEAWQSLLQRHEILRASVRIQEVLDESKLLIFDKVSIPVQSLDISTQSPSAQTEILRKTQRQEREYGISLDQAPLLRLVYLKLSRTRWAVINTHSHLILDGWSGGVLGRELAEFYESIKRGRQPELPDPKQFSDYVEWLAKRHANDDLEFWRRRLDGFHAPTPLPWEILDRKQDRNSGVDSFEVVIESDDARQIEAFARSRRVTVNSVIEAAWSLVLSLYTGCEDVVYGLVVSGRPASLSGVEDIVGMFLNTIPIRVKINPDQIFGDYVTGLQADRYLAQDHEHTPLLEIRRHSLIQGGRELFNSLIARKDVSQQGRTGLRSRRSGERSRATQSTFKQNYPLLINIQLADSIELKATYRRGYTSAACIALMMRQLANVVRLFCSGEDLPLSHASLMEEADLSALLRLGLSAEPAVPIAAVSQEDEFLDPDGVRDLGPCEERDKLQTSSTSDSAAVAIRFAKTIISETLSRIRSCDDSPLTASEYVSSLEKRIEKACIEARTKDALCHHDWLPLSGQIGHRYLLLCGDQPFLELALLKASLASEGSVLIGDHAWDMATIAEIVLREQCTALVGSAALLETLVAEVDLCSELDISRLICCGRMPSNQDDIQRWLHHRPGSVFDSIFTDLDGLPLLYWNSSQDVGKPGYIIFGRPIKGRRILILDRAGRPAAMGTPGRLHLLESPGADGLGERSLDLDDQSLHYGAAVEVSGVCWSVEGMVVALPAFRAFEPIVEQSGQVALIEQAIRQISGLSGAYVVRSDEEHTRFELCLPAGHLDHLSRIDSDLKSGLPYEYCPVAYRSYKSVLFTPTADVDRQAILTESEWLDPTLHQPSKLEMSSLEETIHGVWCDILRHNDIHPEDNFFVLGGHSLSATRVTSRLTRLLDRHVPIRAVFEAPTIRTLADWLINDVSAKDELTVRIEVNERENTAPTTFTQQQLWILGQLNPGMAAYTIPSNIRFKGKLRLDLLESTLLWIIDRHEILRTVFVTQDGEPRQVILDTPSSCEILHRDFTRGDRTNQESAYREAIREVARKPWDLDKGPLLRCVVISLSEEEHTICTIFHHIIADGPSVGIFSRELERIYTALEQGLSDTVRLPELQLQYADYAIWERNSIQGDLFQCQIGYWRNKLEGAVGLELPTDYPRPAIHNFAGKKVKFKFGPDTLLAIKALTRAESCTLFTFFVACYQLILSRYSGQSDVMIGSAMTNRIRSELEPLIGLFVNTIALRTELDKEWTFRDLLKNVKQTCIGAFSNMDLPFEETVRVLQPTRDLSKQGSPLFQHMIINQPPGRERKARDSSFEAGESHHDTGYSNFDLLLSTHEIVDSRIDCTLAYDTELYREDTIERLIRRFCQCANELALDPSRTLATYSLISTEEREQILSSWAGEIIPMPDSTIIERLLALARSQPDHRALESGDEVYSYQHLQSSVLALASYLKTRLTRHEEPIAICLPKSPAAVITILAVMASGAIAVPLDPESPAERLTYVIADSGCNIVVGGQDLRSRLDLEPSITIVSPSVVEETCLAARSQQTLEPGFRGPKARDAAYIIYTSGSTGKPKGVIIEHRNLVSTISGQVQGYDLKTTDRILQVLSLGFDAAFGEIFRTFYAGATLVLPEVPKLLPSQELIDLINSKQVSIAAMSASMLAALPGSEMDVPSLRILVVGGEACSPKVAEKWSKRCCLINGYGPTETTIGATFCRSWRSGAAPPLGRPVRGARVYVLDQNGALVPPDIAGELYIGGNSVGRGYLNRDELTRERFVPDPFVDSPSARMYMTGDRVKWRIDGQLEYIGRTDDQVKIRGYRVELGEVQSAIAMIEGVRQAGVITIEQAGNLRLSAYVSFELGAQMDVKAIRERLRSELPDYMVPTYITFVPELPLNSSGKIDKARLPAHAEAKQELSAKYVEPEGPLETSLAKLWSVVLGLERVGRDDNFFELGGDSISTIRVSARAKEIGLDLDPKTIFKNQSIATLAQNLLLQQEQTFAT